MKSTDRLMISFIGAYITVFAKKYVFEGVIDLMFYLAFGTIGVVMLTYLFYFIWNKMLESDKVKKK